MTTTLTYIMYMSLLMIITRPNVQEIILTWSGFYRSRLLPNTQNVIGNKYAIMCKLHAECTPCHKHPCELNFRKWEDT